jgi:hypothetical protein
MSRAKANFFNHCRARSRIAQSLARPPPCRLRATRGYDPPMIPALSLRTLIPLASLLLAAALGCAGNRSMLPTPVPVAAETAAAASGERGALLRTQEMGEMRTVLHVQLQLDGYLLATSRTDAVGDVLGEWRGWLARTFTNKFPHGALVTLDASTMAATANEPLPLTGFFQTPIGRLAFSGHLNEGRITGELRSRSGRFGELTPLPGGTHTPLQDYSLLVQQAKAATASHIYDPRQQTTPPWTTFWSTVEQRAALAQDDIEMTFGFFDAASALRVSHFSIIRKPADSEPAAAADNTPPVELTQAAPGVAMLRCRNFQNATVAIDAAFASLPPGTHAMIVDLRGCPGGDFSAMRVAAHLLQQPADAGTFVGAAWWKTHDLPPDAAQIAALPLLEGDNRDAFTAALAHDGAVRGRVRPVANPFAGRVCVLIDSSTASAAEPLAAMLQDTGRGVLVGTTTAGMMLSSEMLDLGDGWRLRLPTADYYTAAGVRIEGRGVRPHREVDDEQALQAAIELLQQSGELRGMDGGALPVPAKAVIGDVRWLVGTWVGALGKASIEERWSPPLGGAMLAVSRTVAGGRMAAFEYLRIVERDGGLVYIAQPDGAPPTEFVLTKLDAHRAVFDNPRHDFPQRIVYELAGDGRLTACIDLIEGGRLKCFEFGRALAESRDTAGTPQGD